MKPIQIQSKLDLLNTWAIDRTCFSPDASRPPACWEDRRTQALAQKVDQFMDALLETEEFRSLGQMKRMCRACAEPTSDPTEFNLYGETASFYIWIRAITREKDYNLYVHFYLKNSV